MVAVQRDEARPQGPDPARPPGPGARQELGLLCRTGVPLAFSQCCRFLQDLTNAIVLGRFDTVALAAVSVSAIWTSVTDVMLFSGLGQLSTLCSEAHGAGQKRLVGTWLQLFLVFATVASIPVCGLRWVTSPILQALGI